MAFGIFCDLRKRIEEVRAILPSTSDERLLRLAHELHELPEPGYGEERTVDVWRQFAQEMQMPFRTLLQGRAPVVEIGNPDAAVLHITVTADLDAVCDDSGTWSHSCGHHAQSVHSLGLAWAAHRGAIPSDIHLTCIGCPAEECLPAMLESYDALPFYPGKQKLLAEGAFFPSDFVISTHLADDEPSRTAMICRGARGGIWFRVLSLDEGWEQQCTDTVRRVIGLSAASITVRPAGDVIILTRTHAPTQWDSLYTALTDLGLSVQLVTAYAPLVHDEPLRHRVGRVIRERHPDVRVRYQGYLPGMTDLGDVSQVFPTLQVFIGGTKGVTHTPNFRIVDQWFAYCWPILMLCSVIHDMRNFKKGECRL